MADNLEDRGAQDRSRVSLSEEWEVSYWTQEFNCTEQELKKAVDEAGNSADAVRAYLKA